LGDAGEFTTQREVKKLVVAITSNRGLCGALIVM
jgi:F0F1-type ATP synthase gamma subunit